MKGNKWADLPACLAEIFKIKVGSADIAKLNKVIDQEKETTYAIKVGNGPSFNLPQPGNNQSEIKFSKAGKTTIKIIKKNVDNTFFKDQFDKKPAYADWSQYKPIVNALYPVYTRYEARIRQLNVTIKALKDPGECCGQKNTGLLEKLENERCQYLDSIQRTQIQLCSIAYQVIKSNKKWINYWLWYTGGNPVLNPFGVTSPTEANAEIDRQLASAEATLRLYQTLTDKCCESTVIKDMLDTLKPAISELTLVLVKLRQEKEKAPVRQKAYEDWLKSTAQTETVLNEIVLYASDCPQINWMTHYDAQSNYATMQPDGLLPDLVFEKDALRGLVHNIPSGRKVSAKEVVKEAKLRTEIDVQTDDFAGAFTQALVNSNAISTLFNQLSGILNTIRTVGNLGDSSLKVDDKVGVRAPVENARQALIVEKLRELLAPLLDGKSDAQQLDELSCIKKYPLEYKNKLNAAIRLENNKAKPVSDAEFNEALQMLINERNDKLRVAKKDSAQLVDFNSSSKLIRWLMEQTEPPIDDLQVAYTEFARKKASQEPVLRSEDVLINESRTAKGTNDISYDIFEAGKEKPVAAGSYKTYHTVRFWPSVSINYVFGSRTVSVFDNATGQFRTDTGIDNFEAVVGVKWYLGPSNLTRTAARTRFIKNTADKEYNFPRGNSVLGKLFLTGGLGVTHKFLKNYFLGAGIDIVPGLSVQGGGNLFFRKGYDLMNGQISREYDVPTGRWFFGLAIDPNVVTKLISIF
ncbi:hypothetical protein DUE52_11385 [Larkinella punicea]|uniref:Uncharacterized protein n=1 Tax=Larkinella punicea TaxID=2315727 RepID=A0A368JP51_9BACT|nr:hypothetical protein DUE52_11385 [Larkinella punicea]